ncbi:hypothetical protein RUND412_001359 [Rhizina undulata]
MTSARLLIPISLIGATAALNTNLHKLSPIRTLHCEGSSSSTPFGPSRGFQTREPEPTVEKEVKTRTGFSPALYRQILSGSFMGLAAGLAVSGFSKTLRLVLGSLLFLVEFLAARGWHVIPYNRLQRWAGKVDVRGLVMRNVAFKFSFKASFAAAALYS